MLLSRFLSIKGALVPERPAQGLTSHQLRIFDESDPVDDRLLACHARSAILLGKPEGDNDGADAYPQFAIVRCEEGCFFTAGDMVSEESFSELRFPLDECLCKMSQ